MNKRCFAVIVAGGSGARMGSEIPKQFLDLEGKPIILRTVEAFLNLSFPVEVILVLPSAYREMWIDICTGRNLNLQHHLVSGGITRFHSVKNAMKYITHGALVAVHDGVRPFISGEMIESLYHLADQTGAVIPVVRPVDSMRRVSEEGIGTYVKREEYVMIQTPQVFHSDILLKAYEQAYSPIFTDDASVVEGTGTPLTLAEGSPLNIKITRQEDMLMARAILSVF